MPSRKPNREGGAAAEDAAEQESPETGVAEAIAEETLETTAEDQSAQLSVAADEAEAEETEAEETEAEGIGVEAAQVEEAEEAEAENEAAVPVPVAAVKGPATAPRKELPEYLRRRRSEIGRVVSDKMQKTVVVAVERSKPHPLYKKIVRKTAKFMAHDELGARSGDTVRIIESRPMSRHKRWRVVEIVQRAQQL